MRRKRLFSKCLAMLLSAALTVSCLGVSAFAEKTDPINIEEIKEANGNDEAKEETPSDALKENGVENKTPEALATQTPTPVKEDASETPTMAPSETPATTDEALETPTPTGKPSEEVSEGPVESESPESTESPEESESPEVSESPEESQSPEVSESPEESESPEASESPEESESPETSPSETPSLTPTATPSATPTAELESENLLEGMEDIFKVAADGVTITGLKDGVSVTELVIPKGYKAIGNDAFKNNKSITSVKFEEGSLVTSIGSNAFKGCSNITSVTLPNKLQIIGESAFYGTGITSIEIPESVTKIYGYAFKECNALKSVKINSNISIETYNSSYTEMFKNASINTVEFGPKVTKIPAKLFAYAGFESGYSITIPARMTEIGNEAFRYSKLSGVTFEEGSLVTSIGSNAFNGCSNITSVTLPNKLQIIGESAFYGTGITSIEIPESVTKIYGYAFKECNALKSVKINSNISIETYNSSYTEMFKNASINTVEFGPKVTKIPAKLFGYAGFENASVISIPNTIKQIDSNAFEGATGVGTTIIIPNTVKTIGTKAFTSHDMNYKVVKGSVADTWLKNNGLGDRIKYILPVNYILNGGINNPENRSSVETGDSFTLKDPTRTGYDFEGWYTDSRYTNKITSVTAGNTAITLYAKWKAITYTISYENNGATTPVSVPATYTIASKAITLKNPVRTGYTFAGWYKEPDCSGAQVKVIPAKSTGDITLYAKWIEYSYKLSFNANGGKFETGQQPVITTYTYSQNITLPSSAIMQDRTGYTLTGWNTLANGKGVHYDLEQDVSKITPVNNKAIVLYAQWQLNVYDINYELNGGTLPVNKKGQSIAPVGYTYLAATKLVNPAKAGYTFAGWYETSDFSSPGISVIAKGNTGNKTLYAKWNENSYSLSFNPNGGKFETGHQPALTRYNYTENVTLPVIGDLQSITGYTLVGFNTLANGRGTQYSLGQEVSGISAVNNAKVVLYAQWKVNEYTINYELNGGTQSSLNPAKRLYTAAVTLRNPAKLGYTFAGWYTDSEFTSAKVTAIRAKTASDTNLYAKWVVNKYSVTFNANSGKGVMAKMVGCEYDKSYQLNANTYTKAGYTFNGWNTKPNGTGISFADGDEFEKLVSKNNGNIILYAQWRKN